MLAGFACENAEEKKSGIYLHVAYWSVRQILQRNCDMFDKMVRYKLEIELASMYES